MRARAGAAAAFVALASAFTLIVGTGAAHADPATADFSISAPSSISVLPGQHVQLKVATAALVDRAQVFMDTVDAPAGVTTSWMPSGADAGRTFTLNISASTAVQVGPHPLAITGRNLAVIHTINVNLIVAPTPTLIPDVPMSRPGFPDESAYFQINVPAGAPALQVNATGVGGDLYVRRDMYPTAPNHDCRSEWGVTRTCTFTTPAAGTWYVMVAGLTSNTKVVASLDTGVATLQNKRAVHRIDGAAGSIATWKLVVPAGKRRLEFRIAGARGNADLAVRRDNVELCRSARRTSVDACVIRKPAAGTYYVSVSGTTAYQHLNLFGSYS